MPSTVVQPKLRIDPWDPAYGASVDIDDLAATIEEVRLDVEDVAWAPISPTSPGVEIRCAFIDGVRRVDSRLFAETDGVGVPAVAGSWAVGVAWDSIPPRIDNIVIGRELIVSGGLTHADLIVEVGGNRLCFRSSSVPDVSLVAPIQHLQTQMRQAEADVARSIFTDGAADILVLDGPLHYFSANGPVLGFVKRQNRAYLPADRSLILGDLQPGQRTPLFVIGDQGMERYSWYTRIAWGRPIDGFMTGIVRIEISAEVGSQHAAELASLASGLFPRFASHAWHDPRAPQNLYPVGQLETLLRHRLGDGRLIRRGIETTLWRLA